MIRFDTQSSVSTAESMHMLLLRVLKSIKKCTIVYISSSENPIIEAKWTKLPKNLSSYKFTLLNSTNRMLTGYKNNFAVSEF